MQLLLDFLNPVDSHSQLLLIQLYDSQILELVKFHFGLWVYHSSGERISPKFCIAAVELCCMLNETRSSAIAEGPRDASCQLKSCQMPSNSAETTCTSHEQIEVMKLEGYSGSMCNKHVHTTITRSSCFHCLIGVINKPTTDRVVDITCIPTTCCGEIF